MFENLFDSNTIFCTHHLYTCGRKSNFVLYFWQDAESKKHLRHKIDYHDSNNRTEDLADVLPSKGFPVAFFARKERLVQYQPPAVMVHFNDIRNNVYVNIQCVAWAQNFNDGKPQSSMLYTAKFTFFIK